jgi:phosphohistidine phosphatase
MPQQLWILRHGEAEAHDARPDFERRLTDRGREQARAAGRALAALGVHVHVAFTSPRVRALQTAQLCCEQLGIEPIVHEPLSAAFDRDDVQALLAAAPEGHVLVVGHEPDLSQLVHDLTGGRIDLKKGGLAAVRLDGATSGELIVLLRPRELDRIASSLD